MMLGIDPTGADLSEEVVMRHNKDTKDGPTITVTRRQARIWAAKGYAEVGKADVSADAGVQVQFPPEGEPTPTAEVAKAVGAKSGGK